MLDATTLNQIDRAAHILRAGGLVAFPTETVYGLGADALDANAAAGIFEAKQRPRFDPLIVHIADRAMLAGLTSTMPDLALRLADAFWPGPLTLVLPKSRNVPDIVTSGLYTVALRFPSHEIARALIRAADRPIAAPSANLFGRVSPTCAQHVREQLGDRVDMILDGGPCAVGVESTILSLCGPDPLLLRQGGVAQEELEPLTGPLQTATQAENKPEAPGMLTKHYAPATPIRFWTPGENITDCAKLGVLAFQTTQDLQPADYCEILSPSGDLREAAANLFAALRRLDARKPDLILAQRAPDRGLGRAINDRLARACAVFCSGQNAKFGKGTT